LSSVTIKYWDNVRTNENMTYSTFLVDPNRVRS